MNIDSEILSLLPYFIPKVIVATICGVIIGIDRELKQKAAGVRTFILICVGCAIFTSISTLMSDGTTYDPTRIIGQIITGIGFLGAGVIVKNDDKIVGVTTAAFIWCVSAIGVLAGLGAIWTPIILTIGLLIVSLIFEKFEIYIKKIKLLNKNGESRN
jgi:putative Mg2+ transporter-C (MgtC) family protein